ncbi:hypothetical protein IBG34_11435 [Aeromonas media]|uniref:Uncharacterized protein n=1 Tax=Aeromonas media TaxID=651 RepID=A0A6M4YCW5_AERME|nr:hypothetical protein [Aeromonas media]QJT22820.1 hypothetical protein E4184_16320 [Aeromonas media]QYK79714.1 hypothetical protein IBG34_11435 [Aeromonas media]
MTIARSRQISLQDTPYKIWDTHLSEIWDKHLFDSGVRENSGRKIWGTHHFELGVMLLNPTLPPVDDSFQ